ncbi:MAG: phasin family protein, partial [Limnohabitans sp.]
MQNQFKPQMEASVEAAYELANLSFSQVERLTQLALEQSKVNAELLQDQIHAAVEVKDPAAAIELIKEQLENSMKSFAGLAATAFELSQEFQAETTAFAEAHFDHAHAAANKAFNDNLKKAPEGSEVAVAA